MVDRLEDKRTRGKISFLFLFLYIARKMEIRGLILKRYTKSNSIDSFCDDKAIKWLSSLL